jgi:hypothetical protein
MNYTTLFYWLVVADNARDFFRVGVIIFMIVVAISTIAYFICSGESKDQTMARKWMWWSYPFAIFFWLLLIFTPSKKDALLIVAGGQTLNFLANDKSAKQIPSELSNFVLTEVKNLAADAKVDLGIANQKDKILEKAKHMTTEELMAEMKKDTTFAKVILDK